MNSNLNMSPEELEKALEKAKKDMQAMLDRMTPEERRQAERKAQKLIEEDQASMQRLLDDAAGIAGRPNGKRIPGFCVNCGAPAGGGKFCEYCGSPLQG